jgi:hypothetical protein
MWHNLFRILHDILHDYEPQITTVFLLFALMFALGLLSLEGDWKNNKFQASIYENAQIIESIPFEDIKSGNINNTKEIVVTSNLNYPYDKIVKIEIRSAQCSFEVENDNGKSKVVAVFSQGHELEFK